MGIPESAKNYLWSAAFAITSAELAIATAVKLINYNANLQTPQTNDDGIAVVGAVLY